jgi:PAS domain S-box-containing protein
MASPGPGQGKAQLTNFGGNADQEVNSNVSGQSQQQATQAQPPRMRRVFFLVAAGVAYFLANNLALLLPDSGRVLAAVWPAGGIGLAALLLTPKKRWPAVLLILFVAGNLGNLAAGRHLASSLGFMTANICETSASAWLICRWGGPEIRFDKISQVRALLTAATIVNAATAFIGAATAALGFGANFWTFYLTWWIADALGILVIAPVIVTWLKPHGIAGRWRPFWILECAGAGGVMLALAWAYFSPNRFHYPVLPLSYMLIVPLAWGALRLGPRGVMTLEMALAFVSLALTLKSQTLFPMGGSNETQHMLMVQLFLGVSTAIALLLAASFAEGKNTEQSLREIDSSLRALGDNLPNGMVYQMEMNPGGHTRYLYLSAGLTRLNGLLPEEVMADSSLLLKQISPEDLPAVIQARQKSLEAMSVLNVVVRLRRKDGQLRWMNFCSAPRRLPNGRVIWDGIEIDLTDQREAEAALRESEARYRALVELAPIGLTLSVNDQIVYANKEAARIVGAEDPSQVVGRLTEDFVHEGVWELVQARREKMMATGAPAPPIRRELKRLDGKWIEIEARSSPITLAGKPGIQTMMVDTSDRKRTEDLIRRQLTFDEVIKGLLARMASASGGEMDEEIRAGLRSLATFMNVSSAFVSVISPDGTSWSITHEWSGAGLSGRKDRYQKVPFGLFLRAEKLLLSGQILRVGRLEDMKPEDENLRRKLEAHGVQAMIQIPFRGQGGGVTGAMGMLSIIPEFWREEDLQRLQTAANAMAHALERCRAEQHLQRSREQLRALSARLQSLREDERMRIAREIHDHLGQLLTALSLDLRLIERKLAGVVEPELRSALIGKIASARILADETITSVQKIATELRPAILDRLGLEAAIEAEAAAFASRTGIVCELNMPAGSAPAPVENASACFRIFQEIMTNIARHSRAKHVKVNFRRDEERVLMQVTDDGIGIQHQDLTNPSSLGLLGMMERAEMLGGFTAFGRARPNGTIVTVSLPLKERATTLA